MPVADAFAHALFVVPRGMAEPVAASLPEAVARLVASVRPRRIILFGSFAYGRPNPDSDVDLLVELDSTLSPEERHLAVARQLRPRRFPLDLLVMTPTEVRRALAAGDILVTEILQRGRVLYERPA